MNTLNPSRLLPALILVLLACPLAFLTGCVEGDQVVTPSSPAPPCIPPPSVTTLVQQEGACTAASGCPASYAVSGTAVVRAAWSFPGGTPSESDRFTGEVSWPFPSGGFPYRRAWSVLVCSSRAEDDTGNRCCRPVDGTIEFNS